MIALLALMLQGATPGASVAEQTITVTGKMSAAAITTAARAYLRTVLPTPILGQYARWTVPVCVRVYGIDKAVAARVADRITGVAMTAGARVAAAGCRPNLRVSFSPSGAATAAQMVRKKPGLINRLDGEQTDALLKAALPVRWWHGTAVTDSNGVAVTASSSALMSAVGDGGVPLTSTLPVGPDTVMTSGTSASLIDTHIAIGVTSADAIVDVPLATGKSLDAVADYVAMVALAPRSLTAPMPPEASILALFAPGSGGSAELSEWDGAYLSALYRIKLNRGSYRQRGELVAAMVKAIAQ